MTRYIGSIESTNEREQRSAAMIGATVPAKVSRQKYEYIKHRIDNLKKSIVINNRTIKKYMKMRKQGKNLSPGQERELIRAKESVEKYRTILDDFVYEMVKRRSYSPIAKKIARRKGFPTVDDFLVSNQSSISLGKEYQKVEYLDGFRREHTTDVITALNNLTGHPMAIADRSDYLIKGKAPTISQQEAFLMDMPDSFIKNAERHK